MGSPVLWRWELGPLSYTREKGLAKLISAMTWNEVSALSLVERSFQLGFCNLWACGSRIMVNHENWTWTHLSSPWSIGRKFNEPRLPKSESFGKNPCSPRSVRSCIFIAYTRIGIVDLISNCTTGKATSQKCRVSKREHPPCGVNVIAAHVVRWGEVTAGCLSMNVNDTLLPIRSIVLDVAGEITIATEIGQVRVIRKGRTMTAERRRCWTPLRWAGIQKFDC